MTVARARNTTRLRWLRGKPPAPNLPQHECGPIAGGTTDEPSVLDDLPEMIPVTRPELDVIETYLGNRIDELLVDAASDKAMVPAPLSNLGMPVRASQPRS